MARAQPYEGKLKYLDHPIVDEGGSDEELFYDELVIHCWCAMRSVASIALMYSFDERNDTVVLDEPLLESYEKETKGKKVVKKIYGPRTRKYKFCKNLAIHRLPDLPADLMKKGKHLVLIESPIDILTEYHVEPGFALALNFVEMFSAYNDLCTLGKTPPVIDAADLGQEPEGTLRGLCEDLQIPFNDIMLSWAAGAKTVDGPWASYETAYETAHQSTSFDSLRRKTKEFPTDLELLRQTLPIYNMLRRHVRNTPAHPIPENGNLLLWVGDELLPCGIAEVSVLDSGIQNGDSVWEGLLVRNGRIFKFEEHLDRLYNSAEALAFMNVPYREKVKKGVFRTLIQNGMYDNAYIRLLLTRGENVTSEMDPRCTLIVLLERGLPIYDNTHGIILVTATSRRNIPNNLDSKIRHNNLLSNILAKGEGKNSGADDSIMLDKDGFVSETTSMNFFLLKNGSVSTPPPNNCLLGITRDTVMDLVRKQNILLQERVIRLSELFDADEIWTTGTDGGIIPVVKVDGMLVTNGVVGPVAQKLRHAYNQLTAESGVPIPQELE